jgi:hypothetical protein
MSAAAKLAGFAVLLVLVFGGAALAGGAIGPGAGEESEASARGAGYGAGEPHAGRAGAEDEAGAVHDSRPPAASARGLAVSEDGVTLRLQTANLGRGRPSELRLSVVDRDGERVTDFEVEHEKRMHLIVVRRDGRGFQHLHPEMDRDGTWQTRAALPDAGAYRVFADFKRDGEAQTLASDLLVDGAAEYESPPAPSSTAAIAGGYEVRLDGGRARAGRETQLRFTVTRGGEPVHTQPYLGAGGHLVALREGDLAYLHVHPADHGGEAPGGEQAHADPIAFATEFPTAGRYRLYLQYKHAGRIHTAEFTQEVAR